MKCIARVGITLTMFGLAAGCGGTNEDVAGVEEAASSPTIATEDSAQEVQAGNVEVLHEFDVEGTHYTIIDSDGELLTVVSAHRFAPVPTVVAADGETLTLLEMFLTLQPDAVPDQRLLDDHAAQTVALGRADAAIHEASLELVSTVEKTLEDDCVGFAAGYTGGTFISPFYTKKGSVSTTNGTFTSARTAAGEKGHMMLLACNFNAGAQTETVSFGRWTSAGGWVQDYQTTIAANNTSGIIRNGDPRTVRKNLRFRLVTFPNSPMIGGVFAEDRP